MPSDKAGKLAGWFSGQSEPISVGLLPSPTKEQADPFPVARPSGASSEIRPTSLLQRRPTSTTFSKPAIASRFSFLASKASLTKTAIQPIDVNDDLIDMDVTTALLPAGASDPSSPGAYKNLQQQAENLLLRLQAAYKERTVALKEMAAEKEVLTEEAEGAETRARHVKTQLNDLSVKLAEQDGAMMNLVDELAQEKLARREEEETRKRSIRLVEGARPRRTSLTNTVSDSGFESEDDSSADSVFSKNSEAYSPTMSMSSVSTSYSPGASQGSEFNISPCTPQAARLRALPYHGAKGMPASCQNGNAGQTQHASATSTGIHASEAWGLVDVLKEENSCLKQRIGELEGALDGCLTLVDNMH